MYDIRQFRPTLYILVALGFTGFAIATVAPLVWLLGMAGLALNAWLVKAGRFRPLPRWAANALTLALAVFTTGQAIGDARPIFPIGNFLLILQIIKLFEQRANRDYAQVLVLSLLLMVAAAISTASLIFGLTFIVYLLISPYACLLFHLKVETDHAKRQMGLDERHADPMTLRQDQRFLNRSMTRLTGLVATAATVMAVCVFVFFPRGSAANVFGWQYRPQTAATGLSDQMDMKSVSRVQQNTTQIAAVKVTRNGEKVDSGELYLRGNVYDEYEADPRSAKAWSWSRTSSRDGTLFDQLAPNSEMSLVEPDQTEAMAGEQWVQEFMPLQPINVPFLVAIGRPTSLWANRSLKIGAVSRDQVITLSAPLYQPLNYRVISTLPIVATPVILRPGEGEAAGGAARAPAVTPRVAEYARRPEVSGADAEGRPLAAELARQIGATRRPQPTLRGRGGLSVRLPRPPALAGDVAAAIERHLQTTFSYTLDVTEDRTKDDQADPVERFLYDSKKGWCEHFAGAMTLMCQSLGLQARLVSGYKCDEYNAIGEYWIVRQSHAHAWVEVLVRDGDRDVWQRFDPTSGRDAAAAAAAAGPTAWTKIKHFFEFLEHSWATNVVAYDANTQTNLLDNVENKMVNVSIQANSAVRDRTGWWQDLMTKIADKKYSISETVILGLLTLFIAVGVGLVLWFVVNRIRLTRRAKRIGLGALERDEARRLARQLGFYDEMIGILEQRQIVCPAHMTPLEFGRSLDFLPREAFEIVCRLTAIFYRVRFGSGRLSLGQRRTLSRVVDRLRTVLLPQPK